MFTVVFIGLATNNYGPQSKECTEQVNLYETRHCLH